MITTMMLDDVAYGVFLTEWAERCMERLDIGAYQIAEALTPFGYRLKEFEQQHAVIYDAELDAHIVAYVGNFQLIVSSVGRTLHHFER